MANRANSLPTVLRPVDLPRLLKSWQQQLNQVLPKAVPTPPAPYNFVATQARGGIQLSWTAAIGADGYQLLRSSTGDFSIVETTINLPGKSVTTYFDALATSQGTPTVKKFYRLRATAGTTTSPQSVLGLLTGVVSQTCLATNDTTSTPGTNMDTTTTDGTQSVAGRAGSQSTMVSPLGGKSLK